MKKVAHLNLCTSLVGHLYVEKGYRIVSGAVDFCIDDVLDKCYCVIGDSMNLCIETKRYAQKQLNNTLSTVLFQFQKCSGSTMIKGPEGETCDFGIYK